MTKEQSIIAAKQFRKDADELLQRMKEHTQILCETRQDMNKGGILPFDERFENINEVIAQHIISTRDLESCIMRQGMVLKYIGTPNPYPDSKNPDNTIVNPTADGLKM